MKPFLKENQIKPLCDRRELEEALEYYRTHDEWKILTAQEIKAFGISDYPLLNAGTKEEFGNDEVFDDCVKNAGIFLSFPSYERGEMKYYTYAARDIAMNSVYNRSGTNCRIVRNVTDRKNTKALSAEERGEIINKGFTTSKEEVKMLISDERISFIGSEKYVILPYEKGIEAVESVLPLKFEEVEYRNGYISHEYLVAEYEIKDPEIESYKLMLKNLDLNIDDISIIFRFSSSNVGDSKMSGRLLMRIHTNYIPIGTPQSVWHLSTKAVETSEKLNDRNGASIDNFRTKLQKVGTVLQENEDLIEILGNTTISHPAGCLQRLLELCPSIPEKRREEAVEDMESNYPVTCMAIDVYLAAAGLLTDIKNLKTIIQATEEIAELQYKNFVLYDKERK